MKKILVIGSGGAGKSTFSKRLGDALGLEVIHLDRLYWKPGWVEPPKPEWRARVEELLRGDSWIMDGNYSGTLDIRLGACDTVIFLDVPRAVCLWRVLKRAAVYRSGGRADMAEGCDEHFNPEFMRWIWNYPKRSRAKIFRLLGAGARDKTVVLLRTRAEIESFLAAARAAREASAARARQLSRTSGD
ncbi:MAG TPA: DNA topology modulation protein [Pyrinomonadaceae bacterium]|jgi:adenylate kinase family enzyme|nr:DNA topology modulation protein [Pyrinomonadaceae bacterium]